MTKSKHKKPTKSMSSAQEVYNQAFAVSFDYPVYFTHSLFTADNPLLAEVIDRKKENRRHRVMVYIDSGVSDTDPGILSNIEKCFSVHGDRLDLVCTPEILVGGENAKNGWVDVQRIMASIGDRHMCRQSYVMVLGGGSVLDMVCFSASLVHRGLRLIRVPTTVLAQNDAGVGVKNGMNERNTKNFAGTFAPPFAVINDFDFLKTLSLKDWTGGIAEAFKVAIIKDSGFFSFLCTNAKRLYKRDMAAMEELIHRCAVLHLDHIRTSGDPFEFGSSRPLDFGHWSAHKLEVMSGYSLGHGQSVAIGMAIDAYYAKQKGLLSESELNAVLEGLTSCGLPIWDGLIEQRNKQEKLEVLDGLDQFREHLGGLLTVALPDSIGNMCEVNEIDVEIVEDAVGFLKNYANTR